MSEERRISIESDLDVVAARVEGRQLAKDLGFGIIDQARIATAISELTRNIVQYAGQGEAVIRAVEDDDRVGIEVVCRDEGPGIEDVEKVTEGGFSIPARLGVGMAGAKRLMDEFDVQSEVGVGTTVTIRKWL
jgi:serine/threonine-protein kinase RsbT